MKSLSRLVLRATALFLPLAAASAAAAAPTLLTLTPPNGARFLEGQRFDIRVEGKGTGPFSATLTLDGAPLTFTSGGQNTSGTDGISSAGWGGFNLRGFSVTEPGLHKLRATFTDSTGTAAPVESSFEVVDVGGRGLVKNVIIFLGDGMGVAHRTAARLVKFGVTAGQPNGFLAMDRFPGTGLVTTHSLNTIVTDSAPGMACYVSGAHTKNGQEGVYPANMTNVFYYPRVEYLAEYLHRLRGTSLGIVTTADVEDATPAANAVHTGNRNFGTGIVDQYLDESHRTGLRVLMGGGRRWFLPQGQFGSSRGTLNGTSKQDYELLPLDLQKAWGVPGGKDDPTRKLIEDFEKKGFYYADTWETLQGTLNGQPPRKLLGLFGYGNMNVAVDKIAKRRGTCVFPCVVDDYHAPDQPMLDEMTEAALRVLGRDRDGFVLMVEGAHIDKQAHLMDAERVIGETIEFDNAVAVGRRFAERNPDTLVLVLADHECSGFSLIGALTGGIGNLEGLGSDAAVTEPATQPARQKLVGTYDAAGFPRYELEADGYPKSFDVDGKILVGYGASADRYETWLGKEKPVIDSLLSSDIKAELAANGYASVPVSRSEDASGFILRGQAVGRDQAVHTAADIPVSAYSRSSGAWRAFVGVQTNTDIFFKIGKLILGPGRRDDDSIERWSEDRLRLAPPGR